MCDSDTISKLYANVLQEDILKYHISSADIRTGIQNMKEVYLPNPMSLTSASLDVANYDDPAHRCAYLHKYAPFHTALVAEMLRRAVLQNPKVFQDLLGSGNCNICSLGGGPGSDVIGVLSVLNATFGFFQVSATVVDCMYNWRQTFSSVIQELRYGAYGSLGQCVSDQYFSFSYLKSNLLGTMSNEVHKAIATANLVTMIKFVSAAACKDTPAMIKNIFSHLKPGALMFYIDNDYYGFHRILEKEAERYKLRTVIGPFKHEHFTDSAFRKEEFGFKACCEIKVAVYLYQKPFITLNSINIVRPLSINNQTEIQSVKIKNSVKNSNINKVDIQPKSNMKVREHYIVKSHKSIENVSDDKIKIDKLQNNPQIFCNYSIQLNDNSKLARSVEIDRSKNSEMCNSSDPKCLQLNLVKSTKQLSNHDQNNNYFSVQTSRLIRRSVNYIFGVVIKELFSLLLEEEFVGNNSFEIIDTNEFLNFLFTNS